MHFVEGGLGYIIPFLVVLAVLVFVHESGHYIAARLCGVKVETFSLGFGPELFGWFDRKGTRWKVSALPLGGYVKMFGDADPASTPGEGLDAMTPEERAVSHHHQPVGRRAIIAAAGPVANYLLAIVLLAFLFATSGEPVTPPDIGSVVPGSAAAAGGLKAGDRFVDAGGTPIHRFEDIQQIVRLNVGTPIDLVVKRGNTLVSLRITPKVTDVVDRFGDHHSFGVLGVARSGVNYVRQNPINAIVDAGAETWSITSGTLTAVWQMAIGARTTEELGGPIKIAKLSGEVWQQGGILDLINFMALLSVNLGLINLFPIPVLDGGHLLFYAAEALRGRPLGQRVQQVGFQIGLALVFTLMIFATWNDVSPNLFAILKRLVT
jgi:regulator of sigma E protease